MAVDLGQFLTQWAPKFNLLLVLVVVILFIRFFTRKSDEHIYTTPWKLLFVGVLIFIVEEGLTVLHPGDFGQYPHLLINGIFEIGIITTFTYMLLLQREHVAKEIHGKRF